MYKKNVSKVLRNLLDSPEPQWHIEDLSGYANISLFHENKKMLVAIVVNAS